MLSSNFSAKRRREWAHSWRGNSDQQMFAFLLERSSREGKIKTDDAGKKGENCLSTVLE